MKKIARFTPLKPLAQAMAMALTATASTAAYATTCNASWAGGSTTAQVLWNNGADCLVDTGVEINMTGNTALWADTPLTPAGTLTNRGTITSSASGLYAVDLFPSVTALVNEHEITGDYAGVIVRAGLGALNNSGTIDATGHYGLLVDAAGSITTLNNYADGRVGRYAEYGIQNNGGITTLNNSGVIDGIWGGIQNDHLIGSLSNQGGGSIGGYADYGIQNTGTITTLTNAATGTISGATYSGIYNTGNIGTLSNAGSITGHDYAIYNSASMGTLTNSGTLSGDSGAVDNWGRIDSLDNSGTLAGTVEGASAVRVGTTGSIGALTNSGLIAGDITNLSTAGLTLNGGTGSVYGTLTGVGGSTASTNMGLIDHQLADLRFGSGQLLLNDHILASGHLVTNAAATLQVNNTVQLTGNYAQAQGASLRIGVANTAVASGSVYSDSGYGRLVVSGSATLASGSAVALHKLGTFNFTAGQRFVVLQASANGSSFNEGGLNLSADGYSGALTAQNALDSVDRSRRNLLVCLGSCSSSPLLGAAIAASKMVFSLAGLFKLPASNTNAGLNQLFNAAVAAAATPAASRAGAQLNPVSNSASTQAASTVASQALGVVSGRTSALRLAAAGAETGIATGELATDRQAWGEIFGGQTGQTQRDEISGFTSRFDGLLVGADTALNTRWRVGGVFSYANSAQTETDARTGSATQLESYGVIGYASYAGEAYYAEVSTAAIAHRYGTTRLIDFGGFTSQASGQHLGWQYVVRGEAGYPLQLGGGDHPLTFTPLASLGFSSLDQDGYTESGGGGAALRVEAASSTALTSELGFKLARSMATAYGELVPEARLAWRHAYGDAPAGSRASFADDASGATAFTSAAAKSAEDTAVLSVGLTLLHGKNLSTALKYNVELAPGYTAQSGNLRVTWKF